MNYLLVGLQNIFRYNQNQNTTLSTDFSSLSLTQKSKSLTQENQIQELFTKIIQITKFPEEIFGLCISYSEIIDKLIQQVSWPLSNEIFIDNAIKKIFQSVFTVSISYYNKFICNRLSIFLQHLPSLTKITLPSPFCSNFYFSNKNKNSFYPEFLTNKKIEIIISNIKNKEKIIELNNCSRIDDRGLYFITLMFLNLKKIVINKNNECTENGLLKIADLKNLESLTIHSDKITSKFFENIAASCKKLNELHLLDQWYSSPPYQALATQVVKSNLQALTSLTFMDCSTLTDVVLEDLLTGLPNLTILNLSHFDQLTDRGMRAIGTKLRYLTKLHLDHSCYNLTDNSFRDSQYLSQLSSLKLGWLLYNTASPYHRNNPWSGDNKGSAVSTLLKPIVALCSNLEVLKISLCDEDNFNNEQLLLITKLKQLKKLTIFSKYIKVTFFSWKTFSKMCSLIKLKLVTEYCLLQYEFDVIMQLKNLTSLHIEKISDYARVDTQVYSIKNIINLKNLTTLVFKRYNQFSDRDFLAITKLSNLTKLNIVQCPHVSDKGWAEIIKLRELMVLRLAFCGHLANEGALAIAQLPRLTQVIFRFNYKITIDCLNTIIRHQPMLDLRFDSYYPGENVPELPLIGFKSIKLYEAGNKYCNWYRKQTGILYLANEERKKDI